MRTIRKRSTSTAARAVAGLTLVEVTVVVAVFALLMLAFMKASVMVRDGNTMMEHHNQVNTRCQRILNKLTEQVASSVRLYAEGTEGRDLIASLEAVPNEMLRDSMLPVILPDGIVERDLLSVRRTGNLLVFLQADRPFAYKGLSGSTDVHRIDVHRVVAVYLRRKKGVTNSLANRTDGLDLVMWRSAPLLDRGQLEEIEDLTERASALIMARKTLAIDYVFDTRVPIKAALRGFDSVGEIDTAAPDPYMIPAAPVRGHQHLFGDKGISVATNGAPTRYGVARFAQRNATGEGFPHGFEVRVIGGASARRVLMHLNLVTRGTPFGEMVYSDLSAMALSRDF